jgi:hypothetical protein
MEEIRVQIDYYFWHPVLNSLRASKYSFAIEGFTEFEIVPEPATLLLCSIAVFGYMPLHRRIRSA